MTATVTAFLGFVRVRADPGLLVWRNAGRSKTSEEHRCRLCERPWSVRPPTRHHLVPQSWFERRRFVVVNGDDAVPVHLTRIRDADANIVPLCAPCHDSVERDESARRMLRHRLGPTEAAMIVLLRGRSWFNARYPPTISRRRRSR